MSAEPTPAQVGVDRSEGFGERLLGAMIDRAHEMPPQLIAPLVAEEIGAIGGRDVTVLLQDYEQLTLMALPGRGLLVGQPEPIDGSMAGRAFLGDDTVEQSVPGGARVFVPLLDGTDRVGVLAFTADSFDDHDRRLARRFAGLVADVIVTKGLYTDRFFQARRRQPMSLTAEMQWSLLPPLSMSTPQVAVAGILEPAYDVAGDSFDYALNDDILHIAIVDAMGHGLDAAVMATVAVAAYRHARRGDVDLPDLYAAMDRAVTAQFAQDRFLTAQMVRLDVGSGRMRWVNAGHPHPLLLRNRKVVRILDSPTTLPVGFGGADPQVSEEALEPGDRVLFFTDGIIEERPASGERVADSHHLIDLLEQVEQGGGSVQDTVRRLSHALKLDRGGVTSDDATLFLLDWRAGTADHLAPT
ncbi:MAG: SpoIIE family protein phosphatase [Actinomycetota bacterium]|nr:SpoIIE family protein phosphatase [Actinomycetota bacterium]MDQ6946608.1 SpoIIE family protein phosphatase [Actinomycetota bacterium]